VLFVEECDDDGNDEDLLSLMVVVIGRTSYEPGDTITP